MNSLIKNKTHRRIPFGVVVIISLVVIVNLSSVARTGNFLLANILDNSSTDVESVSDKQAIVVQTEKILPETVNQCISVSAVAEPFEKVEVFPEMNGKVFAFYRSEGDYVNKGQILAKLKTDQSLLTNFENAKTNLKIAKES